MSNEQFSMLLALVKCFSKKNIRLPLMGESSIFDVVSKSTKDTFYLDVDRRGRIELKVKVQMRDAVSKFPLVRIDLNSPRHMNPDGRRVSRNHIHLYRETEYDTGSLPWAYELSEVDEIFAGDANNPDFMQVFYHFCQFCNIETYDIQGVI